MLRKFIDRFFDRGHGQLPKQPPPPLAVATAAADRLIAAGRAAEDSGRIAEACDLYRQAVGIAPRHPAAHVDLGIGLAAQGDEQGAIDAYRIALAIDPGHPYANYNLGILLYSRGNVDQAEEALRSALERRPEFTEALIALSNVLDMQGKATAAADALASALKQQPDFVGGLYNYGVVLRKLGRLSEAELTLRRATELEPKNTAAWEMLALVFQDQARLGEALDAIRVARNLAPERIDLESRELFLLNFRDDISADALFSRLKAFGSRLEQATVRAFDRYSGDNNPNRRLRIGFVSGNFYTHPVALFLMPLLARRDRTSFTIHLYSTEPKADRVTDELRALADKWVDAAPMSDTALADAIHEDAVDILVDLSGHSGVYRLGVFARQPAPVQVSWLGYLNSTGLTRIKYRLCDARTDPEGTSESFHTETLVRLPHSQWCYRPFLSIEPGPRAPIETNGHITFGSFNHPMKISESVCALWAEILLQLPNARLLFAGVNASETRTLFLERFAAAGVAGARIAFSPRADLEGYYRLYNTVDIALDSMPYGGGTTTFDALWMGVPIITVPGATPVSRSAAGILSVLGLDEWVGKTPQDYVRLAVGHAGDPAALSVLRKSLRKTMLDSPIMDEARFAADAETIFRGMWRIWCATGETP
jgi:protein O-GlcNAc transferase